MMLLVTPSVVLEHILLDEGPGRRYCLGRGREGRQGKARQCKELSNSFSDCANR